MKYRYGLAVAVSIVIAGVGLTSAEELPPLVNTVIADASKGDEYLLHLLTVGQVPANHNQEEIKILINHGYVVGYSEERRNPLWAMYRSSGIQRRHNQPEPVPVRFSRPEFFTRDLRTVSRVSGETFGGGFDRGHMVPNFAISRQYGALAQMETFLMTNMCPQAAVLNRGAWADLEKFITELAEEREHIFVFVGPIFGDNPATVEKSPERRIQIPEAFYIIIADTDREFMLNMASGRLPQIDMVASIFPQSTSSDADFRDREEFGASVDEIEERTNLDFFPLAASINPTLWGTLEALKAEEFFELGEDGD